MVPLEDVAEPQAPVTDSPAHRTDEHEESRVLREYLCSVYRVGLADCTKQEVNVFVLAGDDLGELDEDEREEWSGIMAHVYDWVLQLRVEGEDPAEPMDPRLKVDDALRLQRKPEPTVRADEAVAVLLEIARTHVQVCKSKRRKKGDEAKWELRAPRLLKKARATAPELKWDTYHRVVVNGEMPRDVAREASLSLKTLREQVVACRKVLKKLRPPFVDGGSDES